MCVCDKKTHRGGRIGPPTSVGGPILHASIIILTYILIGEKEDEIRKKRGG